MRIIYISFLTLFLFSCASKLPAPVEETPYESKKTESVKKQKKKQKCPDVYKLKKGETLRRS